MSTVYETQPHFVAYLDLLAGKHLIKAEEDESLNRMHSLLQVAKDSGAHGPAAIFPKCKVKIFSDNIIIACRLTGDPAKDYSRILSAFMLVSAIQIVGLEMYHYLFRGAATVGNLFIDSVMVWGSALVRATDMEAALSVYPRVMVDDELLEMLAADRDAGINFSKYSLARDTDGKYYLDYLSAYFRLPHSAEGAAFVGENQSYFRERLDGASEAVREKLLWQTAYLDRYEALAAEAARQAATRSAEQQALVPRQDARTDEARQALEKAAEARAAAEKASDAKAAAAKAAEKKTAASKTARARSNAARTAGAKAAAAKATEARAAAVSAAATTQAVARTAEAAAAGTKARVAGAKAVAAEVLRSEEKKRRRAPEHLAEHEKPSRHEGKPEPED